MNIGMASILFAQPPSDDYPLTDFSFDLIFRLLSFDTIVAALEALLSERKIIICSHHLSVLTPIAEALRALAFPFQWQYVFDSGECVRVWGGGGILACVLCVACIVKFV